MSNLLYIKDIAKITNGKSDVKDANENGAYTFFDRSVITKRSNKYLFDDEAIIIPGEDSRQIFEPRYYNGKFDLHQRCYVIYEFKNDIYPKYLFYKLKTLTKHFSNVFVGSTVPSLRLEHISDLKVILPPLIYQQKIASVLTSLDAKVELNNRINAELEAMAKTLYDYWFVQFDFPNAEGKPYKSSGGAMVWSEELKREIPQGWEVNSLKSICQVNQHQLNSSNNPPFVNYLDTSSITKNQIDGVVLITDLENDLPSRAKRIVRKNDIVYSTVRPNQEHYGIIKEPLENMIVSTGFAVINCKNTLYNDFIYCFLSNKSTVYFLQTIAETSVSAYPAINVDDILNLKIALPKEDALLKTISTQLNDFHNLTHKNQKENQQLAHLRDWLLPMLMNGQVVVE